jgi:hypothetical protein
LAFPVDVGVKVTVHWEMIESAGTRVQEFAEKVPVAPAPSEKLAVPSGRPSGNVAVSVTVAVQEVESPILTEVGLQTTETFVLSTVTGRVKSGLLPALAHFVGSEEL